MPDWSHPRIPNAACRLDAAAQDIAAAAREAFQRRRDTYPQLVSSGQLTADEARGDLEGWRAIAKDWHWMATGDGEPGTRATIDARCASLDTAIERWFDRYDRLGGATEAETEQLALFCAMRIWAGREQTSPFTDQRQFFASINHELRGHARAAQPKDAA